MTTVNPIAPEQFTIMHNLMLFYSDAYKKCVRRISDELRRHPGLAEGPVIAIESTGSFECDTFFLFLMDWAMAQHHFEQVGAESVHNYCVHEILKRYAEIGLGEGGLLEVLVSRLRGYFERTNSCLDKGKNFENSWNREVLQYLLAAGQGISPSLHPPLILTPFDWWILYLSMMRGVVRGLCGSFAQCIKAIRESGADVRLIEQEVLLEAIGRGQKQGEKQQGV
jgi:hypothetical protein